MISYTFLIFAVVAFFFLVKKTNHVNRIYLILIFLSLVLISTFRPEDMPDAVNYIDNFNGESVGLDRYELGFTMLRDLARSISDNFRLFFFVVCSIAILIKFIFIYKISPLIYGSIVVYISYFFILHDMIQIRAGIASGIMLWAIKYIYDRDIKRFLVTAFLAICFHNSALILLPLWFVPLIPYNTVLWLCIIPISYALSLSGFTIGKFVGLLPFESTQNAITMYSNAMEDERYNTINLFKEIIIMRIFICSYFIYFANLIEKYFPSFKIWLIIYIISISSYALLADIPVFAGRMSELLQSCEIIIIPMLIYTIKEQKIAKLFVLLVAFIFLLVITYINGHLK